MSVNTQSKQQRLHSNRHSAGVEVIRFLCKFQLWERGIRGFSPVKHDFLNTPYDHLRNLTPEQAAWMETLLADKEQARSDDPQGVWADVASMLAEIFMPED